MPHLRGVGLARLGSPNICELLLIELKSWRARVTYVDVGPGHLRRRLGGSR